MCKNGKKLNPRNLIFLKESGCSCHMTGRKEHLRDFCKLENVGVGKFGNNQKCKFKGYGKVTNGKFTIKRDPYVERLNHNLISVS
uniref:Retrovirus-related Pol polyprotein from transposon TNT 1-94-like beta-barrel domain-containing protein n=1 Tax=Lactuca sativa TaxID=4236 RepID=A0A9R1XK52_LACSA|nr:hypothetical protein LSAT_V11C300140320 [Lactuca sativa]